MLKHLCSFLLSFLSLASSAQSPLPDTTSLLNDTAVVGHFSHPGKLMMADTVLPFSETSVTPVKYRFRDPLPVQQVSFRSVAIPVAMIGYGALTFASEPLKRMNLAIRKEMWEDRSSAKTFHLDDFSLVAPALAVYGLNIAGVKGRHRTVDRTILFGMSNLIGQALIVSNVKRLTKVLRPDSSNTLSFPSGHTTQAFISAEFLRQEYKHLSPWYGIAGYAVAAGTGFLRMYNNKHWLNDVIAGAGVGILSTRISYWLYPKLKNALFKNSKGNTLVSPTYSGGAVGLALVHQF